MLDLLNIFKPSWITWETPAFWSNLQLKLQIDIKDTKPHFLTTRDVTASKIHAS